MTEKSPWTEVLSHPRVLAWTERVRDNPLLAKAKHALRELVGEARKVADERLPELGEKAKQYARHWFDDAARSPSSFVNATGILFPDGAALPWSTAAISAAESLLKGYHECPNSGRSETTAPSSNIGRLLRELTGAEAACVFPNEANAHLAVLSALEGGRLLVPLGCDVAIDGSLTLQDVAQFASAPIQFVGRVDRLTRADIGAASGGARAIWHRAPCDYLVQGAGEMPELPVICRWANEFGLSAIACLGPAAFHALESDSQWRIAVVGEALSAGADVVLFDPSPSGGPKCSIVAGRRRFIERMIASPVVRSLADCEPTTLAALEATLHSAIRRASAQPSPLASPLPFEAMVTASLENLKNRAERLAPQLAACPGVERATAIACSSFVNKSRLPRQAIPGWGIALRLSGRSASDLVAAFAASSPRIEVARSDDDVIIHLRTVLPAQDQDIAEATRSIAASHRTTSPAVDQISDQKASPALDRAVELPLGPGDEPVGDEKANPSKVASAAATLPEIAADPNNQ